MMDGIRGIPGKKPIQNNDNLDLRPLLEDSDLTNMAGIGALRRLPTNFRGEWKTARQVTREHPSTGEERAIYQRIIA